MSTLLHRAHDRLQSLLLAEPVGKLAAKTLSTDMLVGLTLAACGLAVAVMALAGWLPGAGA